MLREAILKIISSKQEISVLIVGGGVNGIGTFRDLALQGVDVVLVEKGDFCSGASAASSHMLHGGLRYLENAEFRLVKEALTERNRLLQNAPHQTKPLPTTIPIFAWFSGMLNAPLKFFNLRDKPSERGAIIIKAGLTMYDLFTRGQQTLPAHVFTSRAESLKKRPNLNPEIVCTATYYDAWMPTPERICMEMILDAEAANPQAHALNYVRAEHASGDMVMLRDEISGESFAVKPKIVINAAGPWIDFANDTLGRRTQFIGGTKGSHLIIDHPELHEVTGGHELFFENKDGRICLFFPLHDKVIVGTTDIRIDNPEDALCTEEEIDYLLESIRLVFPALKVDRSHIVFQFSGVRPLPSSKAATAGQISRDHSIEVMEAGKGIDFPIYSLVGGKWTTFRAFSEQAADKILAKLSLPRKISTEKVAIGGGKGYPKADTERQKWLADLKVKSGLTQDRLDTLFERYGTRAEEIALFIAAGEEDEADEPLTTLVDYSQREIIFIATAEKVMHLDDLLLRRSLIAMLGRVTAESLTEVAGIVGDALGWSSAQTQAEIERTAEILRIRHGVALEVRAL
jgi:glycerol-3-phosphate dehydrogenase